MGLNKSSSFRFSFYSSDSSAVRALNGDRLTTTTDERNIISCHKRRALSDMYLALKAYDDPLKSYVAKCAGTRHCSAVLDLVLSTNLSTSIIHLSTPYHFTNSVSYGANCL